MGAMKRGSPSFFGLMLLCSVGASCEDDAMHPAVPIDVMTTTRTDPPPDAGRDEDAGQDEDAGPVDAGAPGSACLKVPVLNGSFEDFPGETSTERPSDFMVTRQAENWSDDCSNPRLTISLSDGSCPTGLGHELNLTFSVNDIEDGAIRLGNNAVGPEADSPSIRVRYTRPSRLKPNGVWGTCSGASGQVVFFEAPVLTAGSLFQARYQLELTPCDGSSAATQFVVGTFKVRLSYSIGSVCSTRTK